MANTKFNKNNSSNTTTSKSPKNKFQRKRVVESSDEEDIFDSDYDSEYYEDGDDDEDDDDDESMYSSMMEIDEDDEDDEDDEGDDEDDEDTGKRRKKNKGSKHGKKSKSDEEEMIVSSIKDAFQDIFTKAIEKQEKKVVKSKKSSRNSKKRNAVKKSAKDKKYKNNHNLRSKRNKHKNDEDDDDSDSEDDSDYETEYADEEEEEEDEIDSEEGEEFEVDEDGTITLGGAGGSIILFEGGGGAPGQRNDEQDYQEMMKEDKNEKCDSDDEQTFMKETYKPKPNAPKLDSSSSTDTTPKNNPKLEVKSKNNNKTKKSKKNSKKDSSKKRKNKNNRNDDSEDEQEEVNDDVQKKYAEMVKLRDDLTEQLKKSPKNKILLKAVDECRKSISDLVKKERNKNTDKYYKLVHQDPKKSKNTNEISYFKKKLSHQEQLKVMRDLKEINALTNTDKPYRLSLLESNIPPRFKAIALQKLNVLKSMDPSDSEYYKMKNWVDGFMRVPYGIYKNLSVNIRDGVDKCHEFMERSKATLDSCTYGLDDAKMQILQMVGQWITNPDAMGTAIAIKGPPGTGKTTLVKEGISKILGREFAFIALGGTSDASFLEGHSYTYEGSAWGKIVSILMEAKSMNPVIYFDELDKISDTPKGEEIASILTHLTDTSQNSQFHDKYFSEVHFDLSKCLFIFSYNDESKVNPILKDRMYRIQTKGYNAKEKIIIARKHLLPKIREQVSFSEEDIIIKDDTLDYIITHPEYCKAEQGVRNLKRCLEIIHTKLNLFRLVKPEQNMFVKEIAIEVTFPMTVEKKHVDILIKGDEPMSQSLLAMYV